MKNIKITPVGKLTYKAQAGDHTWLASEPGPAGPDAAPSPSQLFVSSIGLCKSMYASLFCERYKIPLDGFSITLEYDSDPKTTQVTSLAITVNFPNALPDEMKEKFSRFLEKCAVQKAVVESFPIEVKYADVAHEDAGKAQEGLEKDK